jgi:SAM-dependent methyltransferase
MMTRTDEQTLMPRHVDALTAPTLKHLRDRWWDSDFSEFLRDTLRPRPGTRILDVGCGDGTAEVMLGRLHISQVALFAIDREVEHARETAQAGSAHNIRLNVAAADALRLPFGDACFDSTFCVAVLQHVPDLQSAVGEFSRVTVPGGRIVLVEPDNAARYWFSSVESGRTAFDLSTRFFTAVMGAHGEGGDPSVGPKLPSILPAHGIELLSLALFPVSVARTGAPPPPVWEGRREALRRALERSTGDSAAADLGRAYSEALERYAQDAASAGPGFVEIQNTMLFATVGQKNVP